MLGILTVWREPGTRASPTPAAARVSTVRVFCTWCRTRGSSPRTCLSNLTGPSSAACAAFRHRRLLRAYRERPHDRRAAEQRDELASPHTPTLAHYWVSRCAS